MKIKLRGVSVDPQKEPIQMVIENQEDLEQLMKFSEVSQNFTQDTGELQQFERILFGDNFDSVENEIQESYTEDLSWRDRYIRSVAEFENYKKRINKEREDLSNTARRSLSLINYILEIEDDLSLAGQTLGEEHTTGIKIIHEKIIKNLSTIGITEIQTEDYDPDLHEVISMNESGKNKIEKVLSKGWMMDKKPLRYPKIILNSNVLENE